MTRRLKVPLAAASGLLVAALVYGGARNAATSFFQAARDVYPRSDRATSLRQAVSEMNKSLPMMIDDETELTGMMASGTTVIYSNRLVNYNLADLPLGSLDNMEAELKPDIVNFACTTPETRQGFLDNGITMRYVYYTKDRHHLGAVEVTTEDCP